MSTLTEQELQSLRNMGNECEAAADEVERLHKELAGYKSDRVAINVRDAELYAENERLRARVAELESQLSEYEGGEAFTGQLVEIDGHNYGLRHGAARIVKEAMRDAGRYRWLRDLRGYVTGPQAVNISMDINGTGSAASLGTFYSILQGDVLDSAIDAAMAKDGA